MMKIECCAKDCPDRHIGCHSDCERYLQERKKLDECNLAIRKEKERQAYIDIFKGAT